MKVLRRVMWTAAGAVALSAFGCETYHPHDEHAYVERRPVYVEPQPVYVEPQRQVIVEKREPTIDVQVR